MAFAQEKWQEEFNNVIAKKSRIIQRINHSFNSGRPTYNFSIKTSNHSKNESLKQSFNNLIEKKKKDQDNAFNIKISICQNINVVVRASI